MSETKPLALQDISLPVFEHEAGLQRIHSLIHTLKGMAENLGTMQFNKAAATLERAVRAPVRDEALIQSKLEAPARLLKLAADSVQTLSSDKRVENQGGSDQAPLAPDLARAVAVRLREAVSIGDVMAASSVLANLLPESDYALTMREFSESLDFEDLQALADDMEQTASGE